MSAMPISSGSIEEFDQDVFGFLEFGRVADENARELIETGIVHMRSNDEINHRQARNSIAYHLRRSRHFSPRVCRLDSKRLQPLSGSGGLDRRIDQLVRAGPFLNGCAQAGCGFVHSALQRPAVPP